MFYKKHLVLMTLKLMLIYFLIFIFSINNAYNQNYDFLDSLKKCKHKKFENTNTKDRLKRMDECYIGMKLPDFNGTSISGDTIDTRTMRGKIIVINIWALWCGPCIAELPGFNDIVEKYKDEDIEFIALTLENKASIEEFLDKGHKFSFKIIPSAKDIYYRRLGSFGFPRTMIIDRNGIIIKVFSGGVNSHQAVELVKQNTIPEIEKLLKLTD